MHLGRPFQARIFQARSVGRVNYANDSSRIPFGVRPVQFGQLANLTSSHNDAMYLLACALRHSTLTSQGAKDC